MRFLGIGKYATRLYKRKHKVLARWRTLMSFLLVKNSKSVQLVEDLTWAISLSLRHVDNSAIHLNNWQAAYFLLLISITKPVSGACIITGVIIQCPSINSKRRWIYTWLAIIWRNNRPLQTYKSKVTSFFRSPLPREKEFLRVKNKLLRQRIILKSLFHSIPFNVFLQLLQLFFKQNTNIFQP